MLDSFQKLRFSINATNSWCWQFHALNCSLAAEKRMGQAWPDGRELQIWNPKRIGIPKNVSWNSCVEQVCSCMSGSKSKMSHVNEHLSFNHKKRKWSNWHTEHAHIMALHFSFSPYRQHLKDQLRRTWMLWKTSGHDPKKHSEIWSLDPLDPCQCFAMELLMAAGLGAKALASDTQNAKKRSRDLWPRTYGHLFSLGIRLQTYVHSFFPPIAGKKIYNLVDISKGIPGNFPLKPCIIQQIVLLCWRG